ncbi:unnamed protein product [Caenorhabditis bovis]|uniref:Uncharacterized protein n=1 Tax=Caenorhabditis bovis TaxID=2654633 RepID=A0A8S1F611_9PELO|nr:unnamed protein product [Caenorhabditis bovis]
MGLLGFVLMCQYSGNLFVQLTFYILSEYSFASAAAAVVVVVDQLDRCSAMSTICQLLTIPATIYDGYSIQDVECIDMSRSVDSSTSRIISSPMSSFVTPSTSFAANQMHDIYSLAMLTPPPPYSAPSFPHAVHHASQLLLLHKMTFCFETTEDSDIDVVGLSETTKEVSLNDKDEDIVDDTQPLDLTNKPHRPTVIVDHHAAPNPRPHASVRRSVSSVSSTSTNDDIAAHFRRSLSGKWPKRNKTDEARNSPLRRRTSFNTSSLSISPTPPPTAATTPTQTIIVNNYTDTSLSVADHFRRALYGKRGGESAKKSNVVDAARH